MKRLGVQRLFAATLAIAGLTLAAFAQLAPVTGEMQKKAAFERLIEKAAAGSVRVIIGLKMDPLPPGELKGARLEQEHLAVRRVQNAFLNKNTSLRSDKNLYLFDYIPFFTAYLDGDSLRDLASDDSIASIEEDKIEDATLAESGPIVSAPAAWAAGFTGSGYAVAVLDTGVMKTHNFLTGKVISEACYSTNNSAAISVCPGGVTDSTAVGSGVNCDAAVSGCPHGTHVAGIIAGVGSSFNGIAKGANIIAIQVFSKFTSQTDCGTATAPCARSYNSDQIKGLERVLALSGTYNIASVNMSLGGGQYFSNCDSTEAARKAAIDNLRSVKIASAISSGNSGYTNSMGAPGCISSAVSVGSTDDGSSGVGLDVVSSFSNSASFLNLLAPGRWILSSVATTNGSTTTYQNYSGTSMAAPHVAAAFAVLRQKKPSASVDLILNALTATGQPILDTRNGITKPRINVYAALNALSKKAPFDFDGDSRTDLAIFRPSVSEWWWQRSTNSTTGAATFGSSSDVIVPADHTGDGKTDIAVWRPSNGTWYVLRSENFSYYAAPFGASGDIPAPGDFDGDNKADTAVFRPSTGTWYINRSSGGTDIVNFGVSTDKPLVGDFDGDGKSDIAIFRPNGTNGAEWWVRRSTNATVFAAQFGISTDKAVPGDYSGDGKADFAVWRPSNGTWYVLRSEDLSYYAFPFGANGDLPVPSDYDGDGKTDGAVFRPSNSTWYVNRSTGGTLIQAFGTSGDKPLPNAYVR